MNNKKGRIFSFVLISALLLCALFVCPSIWAQSTKPILSQSFGTSSSSIMGLDAINTKSAYLQGGCMDPREGHIYILDTSAFKIFKIDGKTNKVSWYAGNGFTAHCYPKVCQSGDKMKLPIYPTACVVDPYNGDLYVSDYQYHYIRKIDAETGYLTVLAGTGIAGSPGNHNVSANSPSVFLTSPKSLVVDLDYLYFVEPNNNCIRKIHKRTNYIFKYAGNCGTYGDNSDESVPITTETVLFNNPSSIGMDPNDGSIFVSEMSNYVIRQIHSNGTVTRFSGKYGEGCYDQAGVKDISQVIHCDAESIFVDSEGNVIVYEVGLSIIRKINRNTGNVTILVGRLNSYLVEVVGPYGDGQPGTSVPISYTDFIFSYNGSVFWNEEERILKKLSPSGVVTTIYGSYESVGYGLPLLNSNLGAKPAVRFDRNGTMFIMNGNHLMVVKDGIVIRVSGGTGRANLFDNIDPLYMFLSGVSPADFVIDHLNNDIYIAESANVKKIDTAIRKITKYAGGGPSLNDYVNATDASFSGIRSIALTLEGHLLIAEPKKIRMVNRNTKLLTTIAGNGTCSSNGLCGDGGLAISATFGTIVSIRVNSNNDIFIVDSQVSVVRVIRHNSSIIDLFAGNYSSSCSTNAVCGDGDSSISAKLYQPKDLAIHPNGDIYIADNFRIRKVRNGIISTEVGIVGIPNGYDGFKRGEWTNPLDTGITPYRISFSPSGQLFFDDGGTYANLRTLTSDNIVESIAGHYNIKYNGENKPYNEVKLHYPTTVFVSSNADIYIGCSGVIAKNIGSTVVNYARIARYSKETKIVSTFVGNLVSSDNYGLLENAMPRGVSITPVAADGAIANIHLPFGIFMLNQDVYFADTGRHSIRLYNSTTGTVSTIVGTMTACSPSTNACGDNGKPLSARLNSPTKGIHVTSDGTIYISDTKNHRIRKVSNGNITTIVGSGTICSTPGSATCDSTDPLLVKLRYPTGIYVSSTGVVYIADTGNHKILMLSADGKNVSIFAGSSLNCQSGSTVANPCPETIYANDTTSKLFLPTSVVLDEITGDAYIADQGTNTIRRVFVNGTMVIFAGSFAGVYYSSATPFTNEGEVVNQINRPTSLFMSEYGLYVTEPMYNRVVKLNPKCPTGYSGFHCDLISCNDILQNDSSVCNGHGDCIGPNQCTCNFGYLGSFCESRLTCDNILHSNEKVCNGRGICISSDTCQCNQHYYGQFCNVSECNGVFSNNAHSCSSKGICVGFNNCSCNANYYGSNCNITTCNGTLSNSSNVCNNQGSCVDFEKCQCNTQYHGVNCENTWCFGVQSNSSNVCSSSGRCISYNSCQCNLNYYNQICNIFTCDGIFSNNSQTCNGFGQCVEHNTCQCDSQHFGKFCEQTFCFGIGSNVSTVCSAHGNCSSFDNCSCVDGYWGTTCSFVKCNGTKTNDTGVCNGNGVCVDLNNCTCQSGYTGQYCEIFIPSNIGGNSSMNSTFTNLNNTISNSTVTNLNSTNLNNTISNSVFICFGISSLQSKLVCSGNGKCTQKDKCECSQGYFGNQCETQTCYGIMSSNANVCSGQGKCTALDSCSCRPGYGGLNCGTITCFGIPATSENVCRGRGVCSAIDTCKCFNSTTGYKVNGLECENLMCKGMNDQYYLYTDTRACSGRGQCTFNKQNSTAGCQCMEGYYGERCEKFQCHGVLNTNQNACSGNGVCVDKNTCSCYNTDVLGHYSGFNCSKCDSTHNGTKCLSKICNDYLTCSNHGTCNSNLDCVCSGNWYGKTCNVCKPNYFGANCTVSCKSDSSCNSNGVCDADGSCSCFSSQRYGFWKGSSCNQCQDSYFGKDCTTNFGTNVTINEQTNGVVFKLFGSYEKYNVDCKRLIHPSDISLFGSQPMCFWTDKDNGDFKIEFGIDFTLNPNTNPNIRLNRLAFDSTGFDYQLMQVTMSSNIKAPTAVLQASKSTFSICEDLRFDGSKSNSGDKKSLQFKWDITSGQSIPTSISNAVKLNSAPRLQISKGSLSSGVYTVKLSVYSSFSSKQSSLESLTFTISDVPLPSVTIIGKKDISLQTTQKNILIKKSITLPSCFYNDTSLSISWELVSGPALNFKRDSYNNLFISNFTTLGVQQYVFKVTATSVVNPLSSSNDFLTITTTQPPLALSLSLKQSTATENVLQIGFQDPEQNLNENEVWMWSCVETDTNGYCGDEAEAAMILNSKTKSSQLVLNSSFFSPSITNARLTLTMNKGGRYVSDTINLNIYSPPPIINTISIPSSNIITSTTKSIGLQYQIVSQETSIAKLTSIWKRNGADISPSLVKKKDPSSILIDPSTLEEGSQSLIEFTVSYVNKTNENIISSSTKTALFKKSRKPKKCPCSISPSSGIALETEFSFLCENCQNEQNSIEIDIGFINDAGQKIPLSKADVTFSSKIPSPSSSNGIVPIYFDIIDTLTGETTSVYTNVTISLTVVNSIDQLVTEATSFGSDIESLIKDGDSTKSLYVTSTSILTTSAMFKSLKTRAVQASYQELKEKQLNYLLSAYGTTNINDLTDTQISIAILGLNNLLSDYTYLNQEIFEKSVSFVSDIISDSISSQNVQVMNGFSSGFKDIFDSLLKYAKDNSLSSDVIIQLLKLYEFSGTFLIKNDGVSDEPVLFANIYSNIQVDKLFNKDLSALSISVPTKQNTISLALSKVSISDETMYQPVIYSVINNVDIDSLNASLKNVSLISPNIISINVYNSPSITQDNFVDIQFPVTNSGINQDLISCLAVKQQLSIDQTICKLTSYQLDVANCKCNFDSSSSVNNVILVSKRTTSSTPTTPTTPITPTTPTSSSGGVKQSISNNDMIIIIVVCVVGGSLIILVTAIVLIVVAYCLLGRKRSRVTQSDEPINNKELQQLDSNDGN